MKSVCFPLKQRPFLLSIVRAQRYVYLPRILMKSTLLDKRLIFLYLSPKALKCPWAVRIPVKASISLRIMLLKKPRNSFLDGAVSC